MNGVVNEQEYVSAEGISANNCKGTVDCGVIVLFSIGIESFYDLIGCFQLRVE